MKADARDLLSLGSRTLPLSLCGEGLCILLLEWFSVSLKVNQEKWDFKIRAQGTFYTAEELLIILLFYSQIKSYCIV